MAGWITGMKTVLKSIVEVTLSNLVSFHYRSQGLCRSTRSSSFLHTEQTDIPGGDICNTSQKVFWIRIIDSTFEHINVHKHNSTYQRWTKATRPVNFNTAEWHAMTLCKRTFLHLSISAFVCRKQTHCSARYLLCPHSPSLSRERLAKTDSRLEYWLTGMHLITVRTCTHDEWVYGAADKTTGKQKGQGYIG